MDWLSEAGRLLAAWVLILAGLAGSFIPSLPGPPLVFAGVLVYCLLSGFSPVGWLSLAVIGAIGALAQVLDYLASAVGAKKFGGSAWGAWGSILGGLAGIFLGSLPGLLAGVFAGAFVFEFLFGRRGALLALKVGGGSLLGFLGGTLMKIVFSLAMAGIFLFELVGGSS